MNLIVAVSENNVIGYKGKIPWHFPEDLKRFRGLTTPGTVIMGRKTYESLPEPLYNRTNVVVSSQVIYIHPSVHSVRSLEEAATRTFRPFIIGGASLYKEALDKDLIKDVFITRIPGTYEGDTFFDFKPYESRFTLLSTSYLKDLRFELWTRQSSDIP